VQRNREEDAAQRVWRSDVVDGKPGEVRLLAKADPERLRRRLRKATGKKVDMLPPTYKE
jgi:hypothetical protein